ncbi:MSMEG_6728 family protein [Paenarthrobacter sp. NPDC089322]|uniref:MSMEG_6728 family protein n=1 Tax=Paenarthrobacter sp. NPDC089322 TaxID=3155065 RepID=UPI00344A93AC
MQTFLPFADFRESAAALDTSRLGKQRVEALQVLRALVIPEYGWQSHPAVRMWMGHVPALTMYGLAMADEWINRGHPDNTRANITEFAPQAAHPDYASKIVMPPWLGYEELHVSHRSKLIGKDPKFYGPLFPGTEEKLDYVWPEPRHEFHPEDPEEDRLWILRAAVQDLRPEELATVSLPPRGKAKPPADPDEYQFVYAEEKSRRQVGPPKKRPVKQLEKKPTRKRVAQEQAFSTLPGKTEIAVPFDGGRIFALGTVQGRPITVDGQFARNFELTDVIDRAAFDYPALLQDPRVFFPVPAP